MNNKVKKHSVCFDSPFLTGIPENDRVYGEYIDNKEKNNKKCIILLHGFKSLEKRLGSYYSFAEQASEKGFSCFFMHLPFHLERTPFSRKSGEILLDNDDQGMIDFFHQVVADTGKAIDILKKDFKIDDFFVCGLSLGGMCAVFIKAFEKRIRKAVLIECGGNWHEIYWNSLASKIILKGRYLKERKIGKEQSERFYRNFPEFIDNFKKLNIKEQESFCDLKELQNPALDRYLKPKWFLCDPLTWAHRISKDEALMICSRFDPLFNRNTVMQLKKELGDPEIVWINHFHTSGILRNKKTNSVIFDFLDNNSSRSQ